MRVPSSFRDPSGFVYKKDGVLLRQVDPSYRRFYDLLHSSGLYDALVGRRLLVEHAEVDKETWRATLDAYKVIRPEKVDFISYPYEWSFGQLKDAALCTLEIQRTALERGLTLKDASAFNIQFHHGRPVFIDTLSFEEYLPGKPWNAYRQFCQHFLAPLALAAYRDVRLLGLQKDFIDGIPIDLAAGLLPRRTHLRLGLGLHLHLHGRKQREYEAKTGDLKQRSIRKSALAAVVESLETTIRKLSWDPAGTEWADYYDQTNYSDRATEAKKMIVGAFLDEVQPGRVWDLGANTGVFSLLASAKGAQVISYDIDPAAVEKNYQAAKARKETSILPLLLDLSNPTPAIGWKNLERDSWMDRGPTDLVMALALIHHLAISNNVPLGEVADLLSRLCTWLVIEFVPKEDSQLQRLLATREDIFSDYTVGGFEQAFAAHFSTVRKEPVGDSHRTLYLMRKHGA